MFHLVDVRHYPRVYHDSCGVLGIEMQLRAAGIERSLEHDDMLEYRMAKMQT